MRSKYAVQKLFFLSSFIYDQNSIFRRAPIILLFYIYIYMYMLSSLSLPIKFAL